MTIPVVPRLGTRRNVADQIADTLRDLILSGKLPPDVPLNQGALAQQLEASTTPVREALLKLTAEGFILAQPHRAFQVVRMTRQDVDDVFWLHASVASELAHRTLRERGAQLGAELAEIHANYVSAVQAEDADQVVEQNWRFHRCLNSATEGARLRWTLRALLRLTPSTFYRDHRDWIAKSVKSHSEILDAATNRQGARLRKAVSVHIQSAHDDFLRFLESSGYWDTEPG